MSTQTEDYCRAEGIDQWDISHAHRLGAWVCELPLGHDGPHWVDGYPAEDGPISWDDGTISDEPGDPR